jgi:hypothetical protein
MKTIAIVLFALLNMTLSCNSSKQTTETNNKEMEEQLIADGFVKGMVVVQKQKSACPVIIVLDNGEKIDPINIEEAFTADQLNVWVKFARLRRLNRCPEAHPVNITEIQKKAE